MIGDALAQLLAFVPVAFAIIWLLWIFDVLLVLLDDMHERRHDGLEAQDDPLFEQQEVTR